MKADKCAALTMAWRSYDFLKKWIAHYEGEFGRENLFIVSHGGDEKHARIGAGCNIINVPRQIDEDIEVMRWRSLTGLVRMLGEYYKVVLVSDSDEYMHVDPDLSGGLSLSDYLLTHCNEDVLSPVGFHLLNDPEAPAPIDWAAPLMAQVPRALADAAYSKPCVIGTAVDIAPGGHGLLGSDFRLDPALLLAHAKFVDLGVTRETSKTMHNELKFAGTRVGKFWQAGEDETIDQLRAFRAVPYFDGPEPLKELGMRLSARGQTVSPYGSTCWRLLRKMAFTFDVPERLRHLL